MKKVLLTLIVLFILTGAAIAQSVIIREDSKSSLIPLIRAGRYDKELVEITGVVTHWETVPNKTTVRYVLKDRWAELIPVVSVSGHPEVNEMITITGVVNQASSQIVMGRIQYAWYIDEHSRGARKTGGSNMQVTSTPAEGGTTDNPGESKEVTASEKPKEDQELKLKVERRQSEAMTKVSANSTAWDLDNSRAEEKLARGTTYLRDGRYEEAINEFDNAMLSKPVKSSMFYLVVAAAVLLVLLVGYLIYLRLPKPQGGIQGGGNNGASVTPVPVQAPVGATVKITLPPPGTLKVLPGRFEITKGETQLKEVRFFLTKENKEMEYTFGRNPGKPYCHIQVDNPTVSSDQAKLIICDGKYTFINRADPVTKNATKLNGTDMAFNQSKVLNEGDKIVLGTVEMLFHQN